MLNAIRDDEDKAEALGLRTTRYKIAGWCIAAGFVGLAGGLMAHIIGFIDPREVAFAGATFGVWMVLMAILGGKGTIWGPVIGAAIFHVTRELFWTYLFGWQNVALGVLIIVVVVFFPTGLLGWVRQRWPRLFVDEDARRTPMTALLEVSDVTKRYGGIIANSGVSLTSCRRQPSSA